MLDSKSEVPLYIQLSNTLKADINRGTYKKGQKLPTETELGLYYDVSRITVRSALDKMEKDGIITRRRGKGTFVSDNRIVREITGIHSFTQMCRETGLTPGAKTIKCVLEEATDEDLQDLDLHNEQKVMVIERIRSVEKVPVSFEISRFPQDFSFLLSEDLNDCSMFELLDKKYNIRLASTYKYLSLAYTTSSTSLYLDLPQNHPLILINAVSSDETGRPVHRSFQYIVGDKIKLKI